MGFYSSLYDWGGISLLGCLCMVFKETKTKWDFGQTRRCLEVTDIKKYNHAMSKLFGTFGVVLMVLGLPLLAGQNSAWTMLSVVGVMVESIAAMVVYTIVIEKKYRK